MLTALEKLALAIVATVALVRDHVHLVDEDAAEAVLDRLDALDHTVTDHAGVVPVLTALANLLREVRLAAEVAQDASAARLRRREDHVLFLRDRLASRQARGR